MLGKNRIDSIAYHHIKKEYAKYGGFYEGRRPAIVTLKRLCNRADNGRRAQKSPT